MRLMPRSLAGQFTMLLLIALGIGQTVALSLFAFERFEARRGAYNENAVQRMATVVRLLTETESELEQSIIDAATNNSSRFWLTERTVVQQTDSNTRAHALVDNLSRALEIETSDIRLALLRTRFHDREDGHYHRDDDEDHQDLDWFTASIVLSDGRWLNFAVAPPPSSPLLGQAFLLTFLLSAIGIASVSVLMGRWITTSIRRLSDAASRFGRREEISDLPVKGPLEIRETVQAFNLMRTRLNRFIRDRTNMLAAISHDLKTPITSLRLHAEFIDNKSVQSKVLAALDEMKSMTEDTLAFIREDSQLEKTNTVDLVTLVESVANDLSDIGHTVEVAESNRILVRGRATALRRAIRNLLVNAIEYGKIALVRFEIGTFSVRVIVEDEGPGIPEAELDRVLEPFVRIEGSRSRETGGAGLGLSIVRSIVRSHGGDIILENRATRGLRTCLVLPLEKDSA